MSPRIRIAHGRAKLFAVFLALLLYATVYLDQEHEVLLTIPLVVDAQPAERASTDGVPTHARVRLVARGRVLARLRALGSERSGLFALVRPEAGRLIDRTLVPEDVVVPLDMDARVLEIVEPRRITLRVDALTERELPVHVQVTGTPASGHAHTGELEVTPATVLVEGPHAVVDSLDAIETEPIDLSGREGPVNAKVRLFAPDGVRIDPEEVLVSADVEKTTQLQLEAVPVIVRNARQYRVRPVPESARLTLIGPESRLVGIEEHYRRGESTGLVVVLDASGLGPGAHEVTPVVELPSRLRLLAIEPPRILLHVLSPDPSTVGAR